MAPIFDSPPATPNSFSQPRPRPPRSPGHLAQIRTQNRRRAYLERHEAYFQSSEHELADPLLYDFLIRRFQTPSEREAEGRAKGYARVLEGSLLRGEERLAKLREQTVDKNADVTNTTATTDSATGASSGAAAAAGALGAAPSGGVATTAAPFGAIPATSNGIPGAGNTTTTTRQAPNQTPPTTATTTAAASFATLTADLTTPAKTRDDGRAQWEEFLRDRFIRGEDEDFDYAAVDGDDEYDVLERVEREEAWFEEEEAGWVGVDEAEDGGGNAGGSGSGERGRVLRGETGVQDF